VWTVVNKAIAGIIAIVIGDRSAETFKPLWQIVKGWQCFFYVTDGYVVYPQFIEDADHIVNKTYMTRVEGENTRLRHYLARMQLKNFMLLQISRNVKPIGEVGCLLSQT
jgi:insertion element IS1 protein InsB